MRLVGRTVRTPRASAGPPSRLAAERGRCPRLTPGTSQSRQIRTPLVVGTAVLPMTNETRKRPDLAADYVVPSNRARVWHKSGSPDPKSRAAFVSDPHAASELQIQVRFHVMPYRSRFLFSNHEVHSLSILTTARSHQVCPERLAGLDPTVQRRPPRSSIGHMRDPRAPSSQCARRRRRETWVCGPGPARRAST
jgi:hypothetical protein